MQHPLNFHRQDIIREGNSHMLMNIVGKYVEQVKKYICILEA